MRKDRSFGGNAIRMPTPSSGSLGRGGRRKSMDSIVDIVGGGGGKEERILVSVRIRPLNGKEIERNDISDWECINRNTIIFKNSVPDRTYPTSYAFDRVFGCDSTTKQVYDGGAKEVALSVVSGINSSIFAYGQTSSGKTYTMNGITLYSVSDIYEYIHMHKEREFVLKFSAMEIYNEAVKDLLSSESGPLRLLDDPEKGTIVERLTEEKLRDQDHFKELLSICEAQRQIGETSMNELSSRSHQILRLSIESSAKEYSKNNFRTLSATVNFVDLAGSERASQASTAGSRLKEGCHINRSLLTLGSVIRKLSKGRNEHVPYRDSKLTRILQSSLGGNARTAIICTMSPARIHIEQSRNTLQFASAAKDVVNSAHVNVIMSDKALVKHLRKELARMENEMRSIGPASITCPDEIIKEKESQIQKMEEEMKELIKQRDLAQSRIDYLLRAVGDEQDLRQLEELGQSPLPDSSNSYEDSASTSEVSGYAYQMSEVSDTVSNYSSNYSEHHSEITNLEISQFTSQGFDDNCKEIQCIDIINQNSTYNDEKKAKTVKEMIHESVPLSSTRDLSSFKRLTLLRNSSCMETLTSGAISPWFDEVEENENRIPNSVKSFNGCPRGSKRISAINYDAERESHLRDGSENYELRSFDGDVLKPENSFDCDVLKPENSVEGLKETTQDQNQKEDDDQYSGIKETVIDVSLDPVLKSSESSIKWKLEFERKQQEIVELWHACNTSLIHRSYFFLLIEGDCTDYIYMEVEHRRLSFMKNSSHNASHELSLKKIRHEREKLVKMMYRLPTSEREILYTNWCIPLDSKQRRRQLARKVWTETNDIEHVRESAATVEKLFGYLKQGLISKEMFGLNFTQFNN